jgi:hypothetical protein
VEVGGDPSSSNVYGAVIEGVHKLDRALTLRQSVNELGVLTTGTLIVVSDGDDRASLRTSAEVDATVQGTSSNVITVGLGDVANYPKLTTIGRDGSFSAPEPSQLREAFQQIATRIRSQRDSLYLVGYCSPKRTGAFETRVGIRGFNFNQPTCPYNATRFTPSCGPESFVRDTACAGVECGGVIGCGECPAGQCCANGACVAPSVLPATAQCGGEWMCSAGSTCSGDRCVQTVGQGALCDGTNLCDLGVTFCAAPPPPPEPPPPATCMPARADGDACMTKQQCQSLHCGVNPDFPGAASKICRPAAE